ncbi:SusE domain-containing protein [Epilithonimonas mollis]|uniref:Uncharacterized protein n=1 Tax=Epilithonimonas mollis TaxID=216903 RepID=A0A1M6P2W9_9FLAO|nr:SusE domain-containing protein [Epilithonimonas mollis]SHK02281.1 protein of unknown function [Epilithonimonas mollis]
MKKYIVYKLLFTFLMFFGIISCDDRENLVVESSEAPIVIDLSKEKLLLDENFPENPALTITWDAAKYNTPVEVKYDLEISATDKFEAPYVLTSTIQSQTYASFTNKELNEAAKKIGLVPYVEQKMFFRITSHIGSDAFVQQSNITGLSITPYAASPVYEYVDLYLIGNSTPGTWTNSADNINLIPLLKNPSSKVEYSYTGYFKATAADAGFKIIQTKGLWNPQYGKGGSDGQLSTDGGSGNLTVPSDGYYNLSINIANLTYTIVPVDNPAQTFNNVSIIGNEGDWNTDIQLTQSTFDPHLWIGSSINLSSGKFKFRANNNWDVSWGTNAEFFGTTTKGGPDIPVSSEWVYDVYFNDMSGNYTIIPVK